MAQELNSHLIASLTALSLTKLPPWSRIVASLRLLQQSNDLLISLQPDVKFQSGCITEQITALSPRLCQD